MLFSSAINYARLSEFQNIYEKCVFKIGSYYPNSRHCEALSTKNQALQEEVMQKVKDWVFDPTSESKLVMTINSLTLRKSIDKRVRKEYHKSGMYAN